MRVDNGNLTHTIKGLTLPCTHTIKGLTLPCTCTIKGLTLPRTCTIIIRVSSTTLWLNHLLGLGLFASFLVEVSRSQVGSSYHHVRRGAHLLQFNTRDACARLLQLDSMHMHTNKGIYTLWWRCSTEASFPGLQSQLMRWKAWWNSHIEWRQVDVWRRGLSRRACMH